MTATSRDPRPRVADEKNSARGPSKKRRPPPPLTATEQADCRALQVAYNRANAGKHGRKRISDQDLADAGAKYGGASHRQQWYRYRNGVEAIPPINQMVAAIVFGRQPQDIFPNYREAVVAQVRTAVDLLMVEMNEVDRSALMFIVQGWLDGKRTQRDKLLRFAEGLFDSAQQRKA